MITILNSSQLKNSPWKNGLGLTTEIAIDPPGSDLARGNFHWRLSSAQVNADSSFSLFPGFARLLFILSGEGLKLNEKTLRHHEFVKFSGDEKIEATLINDPVVDLGVIYNPRLLDCEMRLEKISLRKTLELEQGTHFIKSLSGTLAVNEMFLNESDYLRIDASGTYSLSSKDPNKILVISIYSL